jgi:hypothetical protein
MLLVSNTIPELESDKARLLDYFLLFPSLVHSIRLPSAMGRIKKQAAALKNQYRDPINPKRTFRDIQLIQNAAIKCMAGSNLIDHSAYESGLIVRSKVALPEAIIADLNEYRLAREPVSTFILDDLAKMPLLGIDGLKSRSGLMEHRYDVT